MTSNNNVVVLTDYRHPACGRVLFSGVLIEGSRIRLRCPKCGAMVLVDTHRESDHSVVRATLTDDVSI